MVWDDISLTLKNESDIVQFEADWQNKAPWLFSQKRA